ncbi:hypothetical protein WT26_14530 [Burkholderia cepacia]|uniref:Uncharacterized protein n=2 Tax=Burkholderia cepacia complex TaxID=87882 RepID=A0A1B4PT82_BURCE|nr:MULTISPECIES: hypothetical protein [Burkholderia cepacia complex]AOK17108.1 hypothetical protein WT26_14530 [Burkholderia cepacia]AOK23843.1 hypothetical protein WK67_14455 [Burkholderia ubonensis]
MIDYLGNFPFPPAFVPTRLRELLEPIGKDPGTRVEVSNRFEHDPYGPDREYVHMLMAVVADDGDDLPIVSDSNEGTVAFSVPVLGRKGASRDFAPSVDGNEYIVASWGSGSFHTYNLAEKVWMALGLTPRCLGNEAQRLVYDDLELPEFDIAEGEVSGQYYFQASRNISWKMSNEYLRRYLWMRGARGVRVLFYETLLDDRWELREWMGETSHAEKEAEGGWCTVSLQEHDGGLLLQVWASVEVVDCELCPEQTADGLVWPGIEGPMTRDIANAMVDATSVYLDDRFLERYEQNRFYKSVPVKVYGHWHCSPSYLGQWAFTDCRRVGRNMIKVSLRELYKPKPDREILHAYAFALGPEEIARRDLEEEHIVGKTERFLEQLLALGDHLSALGAAFGQEKQAVELIGIERAEIEANGWLHYPMLARLAQVSPREMSQQAFLSRCKSIHEIWQRIPDGYLRRILEAAGVPRDEVKGLGSLRLLQLLLNIAENLDANDEALDAFFGGAPPDGRSARNPRLAALFINNDLRIADAHDVGESLQRLEELGFDTASVNRGYGSALDFIFDGVIAAFAAINEPLRRIIQR